MPAGQSGARLPMRRGACLVLGLAVMVVVCIFFPTSPTHAAKRLALVIGNNAYENVPALQKAVNDSEAISQELVKLGFAVVSAENVGRRAMSRGLVELESKIESGDTALIYFAGHGFAVDGTNYLLPVDVPAASPGEEGLVRDASFAANQPAANRKLHPFKQRLDGECVFARGCDPVRLPHRGEGKVHRCRLARRA